MFTFCNQDRSPSLGSPSRPKTPANFDENPSRNHKLNQITNLMAGAATRKATKQQGVKLSEPSASRPQGPSREPVRSFRSSITTSMCNASDVLNDLSCIESSPANFHLVADQNFVQGIEAFVKFLQALRPESVLSTGTFPCVWLYCCLFLGSHIFIYLLARFDQLCRRDHFKTERHPVADVEKSGHPHPTGRRDACILYNSPLHVCSFIGLEIYRCCRCCDLTYASL